MVQFLEGSSAQETTSQTFQEIKILLEKVYKALNRFNPMGLKDGRGVYLQEFLKIWGK